MSTFDCLGDCGGCFKCRKYGPMPTHADDCDSPCCAGPSAEHVLADLAATREADAARALAEAIRRAR